MIQRLKKQQRAMELSLVAKESGLVGYSRKKSSSTPSIPMPAPGQLYRLSAGIQNKRSTVDETGVMHMKVGNYRSRPLTMAPPIAPLKPMPPPKEKRFLEAAGRGDQATIENSLASGVNFNCCDVLGRTALEIAVDNENVEIVETLLKQPGIKIGLGLLYAIREGVYKIVEMLIDHESIKSRSPEVLGDGWRQNVEPFDALNYEYSVDITPIMLAAHLNQFEILKLLKDRGANIHKPHSLSCSCPVCEQERLSDNLRHSLRRIHAFRALASPAWISLTSNDPVYDAFKLSWELQNLALQEFEFKELYLRLSEQCKSFACDLLSQCRSTEEVIAVLNKDVWDDPDDVVVTGSKLSLSRLKLALKYEQKQFVAHPHCQQLLTSIWYEGFPGRQERGSMVNYLICFLLIILWPVLAFWYILFPKSRIGQVVRSPFMKFLYYSTSFGTFLCLLTMATLEEFRQSGNNDNETLDRVNDRGPPPTVVEMLIVIFVLGMVWAECKQLWDEGVKRYVLQWWNWLDFTMMTLYLATIAIRIAALHRKAWGIDIEEQERTNWKEDEPVLLAEGLFAVANVFSFARIIYLFQTNPYLGPLQISLGCMLMDIVKFFFIFFLVLSSFAFGLHQLYWYYDDKIENQNDQNTGSFSSIEDAYVTLLWSLFSITSQSSTNVKENHRITESIGRGLHIAYHVTSIIVLLNMLIAMMSNSFLLINENSDVEWKFYRSKLWMSYFDEGSSLPAPFNIIPTPKSIWRTMQVIMNEIKEIMGRNTFRTRVKRATIRRPGYSREKWKKRKPSCNPEEKEPATYREILERLVHRYIHMVKKEIRMDGVSEDDLLEIKQDISSLRYELREDRRREVLRSSTHIDGVKKEIIRTLSTRNPTRPGLRLRAPSPRSTQPSSPESPRDNVSLPPTFLFDPASPPDETSGDRPLSSPGLSCISVPEGTEMRAQFGPSQDTLSTPRVPPERQLSFVSSRASRLSPIQSPPAEQHERSTSPVAPLEQDSGGPTNAVTPEMLDNLKQDIVGSIRSHLNIALVNHMASLQQLQSDWLQRTTALSPPPYPPPNLQNSVNFRHRNVSVAIDDVPLMIPDRESTI